MKTKEIIFSICVVFFLLSSYSCSNKRDTVDVKPINTFVKGELDKYLGVIEGNYTIKKNPEKAYDGGYDYLIEVQFKSKDSTSDMFNGMSGTYLELIDMNGHSVNGIDKFGIENTDKLFDVIKNGGTVPLTFKWHADKESEISKNGLPVADSIKGFVISSEAYNETARVFNKWQATVDEYCKLSYEDIDIMKGKKKVAGRYRDELLDKILDLEDKIKYDLDKLTPEQVKQFEKCTKDYEDYTNK